MARCTQCGKRGLFLKLNVEGLCNDCAKSQRREEVSSHGSNVLPPFLLYPDDPIAKIMFESETEQVLDPRCGYRFMLYTQIGNTTPEVEADTQMFEINETHFFHKPQSDSWCTVSTMKGESVKNTPVCKWVESDNVLMMFGATDQLLRLPKPFRNLTYRRVALLDMQECFEYNKLHGFDESHVYCHVFYLNNQLYKKFILVAKKQNTSWRVEVNIPSNTESILPPDFTPPGMVFGSFYPESLGL